MLQSIFSVGCAVDGKKVELRLETVFQDDALPGKLLPRVLEGEGFGIIEDCGGVSGLERLAKAFQKEKRPGISGIVRMAGHR